jgi:hypothetical protein
MIDGEGLTQQATSAYLLQLPLQSMDMRHAFSIVVFLLYLFTFMGEMRLCFCQSILLLWRSGLPLHMEVGMRHLQGLLDTLGGFKQDDRPEGVIV